MFNKNPTIILNGLSELARQMLPLLVVLDLIHLTDTKLAALTMIISITLAFVSTIILKGSVTPNETSDQLVREGVRSPTGTTVTEIKEKVEAANV